MFKTFKFLTENFHLNVPFPYPTLISSLVPILSFLSSFFSIFLITNHYKNWSEIIKPICVVMFSFHILDGYKNCFPKLSVAMNKQVVVTVYLPYCRQLYDHCVRSAVMGKKKPDMA